MRQQQRKLGMNSKADIHDLPIFKPNDTSVKTDTATSGHSATTTSGQNATYKRNIK